MSQYVLVDVKHDTFLPFIQSQGENTPAVNTATNTDLICLPYLK